MTVAYARNRGSFGKLSGSYRVLAADTGLIALVPAPRRSTIFVQKIHIEVTTPVGAELWTFQDGQGIPLVPSVSAAAVAHFDFDFGPDGVPCTAATAFVLNITGATGAIGWITWEAFQQLVPVIDYASLILALAPLAYWRLEESIGSVFEDASGNAHHAFGGGAGFSAGVTTPMRNVIYRRPSARRDDTYGIQSLAMDGCGVYPITVTVSPSTVTPTGAITVTWAGIPAVMQAASNWISISKVGRAQSSFSGWQYITNSGAGSMAMAVNAHSTLPLDPGLYDVYLNYADSNNILQRVLGQLVISPSGPSGGVVSSPSPAPLVLGTTCTFECWLNLHGFQAAGGYGFIVGDTGGVGLYTAKVAGLNYIDLYYAGDHLSSAIQFDMPYYIAVVCKAGAVTFYLNGQPAGTAAGFPGMTITGLFSNNPTGPLGLVADIDDLIVYGTALTPDIIAAHAARWT